MKALWAVLAVVVVLALLSELLSGGSEEMTNTIVQKPGTVPGIDVSHYQGNIDWTAVADAGAKFAFIKASEGATWKDPNFQQNYLGAKDAGIATYAYHFYNPAANPKAQAQNFLSQLKGTDISIVAVDLEDGPSWQTAAPDQDGSGLASFISEIVAAGLTLFLYAKGNFLKQYYPHAYFLEQYGLWPAQWDDQPISEANLGPFHLKESFRQYSAFGQVNGIVGNVDLDYYAGYVLP